MAKDLLIKGGTIVDVDGLVSYRSDVLIDSEGVITDIGTNINDSNCDVIDARGLVLSPGFVDIHVHFREPGFEHKEDIHSGMKSALAGGFTTVACMPNTHPVIDNKSVVDYLNKRSRDEKLIDLKIIGSISKGLNGKELSDIDDMYDSGIVAISDDGKTPMDDGVIQKAFLKAKEKNLLIISHCEDHNLSKGGHINEGEASNRTGIKGIPREAESRIVERDIQLSQKYNTPIHIAHVSIKESLDIINEYKLKGTKVTCEVAPHHFILDDSIISRDSTLTKVNPPIRSKDDVEQIIRRIKDGTIDIIATDHAPHDMQSKDVVYEEASFGITGLETSFSLSYTYLVKRDIIKLEQLIYMMTKKPLEIIGIKNRGINIGALADITIIDLDHQSTIDSSNFKSKGKNTPFDGMKVYGKIVATLKNGKVLYKN